MIDQYTAGFSRRYRVLLVATTIIASATCVPAFAQDATPTPTRTIVDSNGVDLGTGRAEMGSPSLSMGTLSFGDVWNGPVNSSTFTNMLFDNQIIASVFLNGRTTKFAWQSDGTYLVENGRSATLTLNGTEYLFVDEAGDRYEFVRQAAGTVGTLQNHAATLGSYSRLKQITKANGEVVSWNYVQSQTDNGQCTPTRFGTIPPGCQITTWERAQSITASTGYMLKATYLSNAGGADYHKVVKVQAINLKEDYCDPLADACMSLTKAWPEMNVQFNANDRSMLDRTFVDSNGNALPFKAGSSGPTESDDDGIGNPRQRITYYSDGRVHTVSGKAGSFAYSYYESGGQFVVTMTNVVTGATTTDRTDIASTRLKSKTDALGRTTSFAHDGADRLIRTVFPDGNQVHLTYDQRNRVVETRRVAKPGSGLPDIVETAGYVLDCTVESLKYCLKPVWVADGKGNRTDYVYSADHGELLQVRMPAPTAGQARPEINYSYVQLTPLVRSASGGLTSGGSPVWRLATVSVCATAATCAGSAAETRIVYEYDPANGSNAGPKRVTRSAGDGSLSSTVEYRYDAQDNVIEIDGPLAGPQDISTLYWDGQKQLIGSIGPDPDGAGPMPRRAQRFSYTGTLLSRTDIGTVSDASLPALNNMPAAQSRETTYDADGLVVANRVSAGGVVHQLAQYSYDGAKRLECMALRMNQAAFGSLPGSACMPGGGGDGGPDRITRTMYDAADQVTQSSSGVGTPDESVETATYTLNGNVASASDANGNRTSYEYDGHDRLALTRYPVAATGAQASSGADYEQTTFDPNGNAVSRRLRDGQVLNYGYDALNRRVFDDNPNTNVAEVDASYTYNNLGQMLTAADTNGWFAAFEYDALGRMTRQYSNVSSNALQYDTAGRLTRQTWQDGFFVNYEHLVTGEVTAVRENGGFALATYGYDAQGRRASITRGNGTVTSYGYDAASRLVSMGQDLGGSVADLGVTFGYNPAGQITQRTASNPGYAWTGHVNVDRPYAVNGLNQYTQSGAVTPTYDARGNLTSAGGSATYGYNTRNQLFTNDQGHLFYRNPMGLLNHVVAGGAVTNFDYVGANAIAEFQGGSNAMLRRYVYGPGSDEPLVWYEGAGTNDRRWLHADERGSVIAVTGGDGNAIAINKYDEYGIPEATNVGRFQYTGQKWIPELGMYDYKARMYSPTLGRFLQTDPIGYADGMNWYNYVGGDPVNATDPSGMQQCYTIESTSAGLPNQTNGNGDVVITGGRISRTTHCLPDGAPAPSAPGIIVTPVGPATPPQKADPPQRMPRRLSTYERRILKCNGADSKTLDGVTVAGFLPPHAYLDPKTDGQTLPDGTGSTIFLRNGNTSGATSHSQMGLIAHEFSHSMGYNRGVSLADILIGYARYGYRESPAEVSARAYSDRVINSIRSGKCR